MGSRLSLRTASAAVLLAVTLTGCSEDADRFVSNAKACADLAQTSAGWLDDVQRDVNSPRKLERTLRQAAKDVEQKASEIEGADAERAVDDLVANMQRLAERAQNGERIELADLREANEALVDACT